MKFHHLPRLASAACAVLVAACATPPDAPGSSEERAAPSASVPATVHAFEQHLRERALAQARQGRLADAEASWEILVALRPDVREYRERLGEAQRQIDAAVPERWQRAQQALRRGDLEGASALFLSVLALQPDHEQAADALRAMERDRNKSLFLGKFSRITLGRSGAGPAAPRPAPQPERDELEEQRAR